MSNAMSFALYQRKIDNWILAVGSTYFPATTNVCMLTEEVGEVARLISRAYGEQRFKEGERPVNIKEAIADELADVLFIVGCIANDLGIDLTHAVETNFDKKTRRDMNRYNDSIKVVFNDH
jgi:NTP pyrophosphatase (non-canonical NTP hydrolase)